MQTSITPQQKKYASANNALKLYKSYIVGEESSYITLIIYEFLVFLGNFTPSIFGVAIRILVYKIFLKKLGKKSYFGKNVEIRNPSKIKIGKKAIVDDNVLVDARGENANIDIGDFTLIGKNTMIISKNADIKLEDGVNISSFCRIASESKIHIGKSTLISAYSYIGPGNHSIKADENSQRASEKMDIKGGVYIGDNCWVATRATILDGVKIGNNSIVAAHSFVNKDVPENVIVAGTPAKIIRYL
ncbi:MAG: acyltransferase [Bdellovibrionota bacterium]